MIPAGIVACLLALAMPFTTALAAASQSALADYLRSADPRLLWEAAIGGIVVFCFLVSIAVWVLSALRKVKRSQLRRNASVSSALNCDAALLSPSTGIIDSHAYMLALRGDAEAGGAAFAFHTPLLHAKVSAGNIELDAGGEAPMTLTCSLLVNAAGLNAPAVARAIDGMPLELIPRAYLAKGNYFSCSKKAPFSHLIYPVPEPGGLGVHLTLDMAGQARFGPDVEWVDSIDYAVDPARSERFYPAIRKYWPALPDGALMPSYSGIRPKIVPPSVAYQDFLIQGPKDHGVEGLINLFGIESPGLTSSLAIADYVGELAGL